MLNIILGLIAAVLLFSITFWNTRLYYVTKSRDEFKLLEIAHRMDKRAAYDDGYATGYKEKGSEIDQNQRYQVRDGKYLPRDAKDF